VQQQIQNNLKINAKKTKKQAEISKKTPKLHLNRKCALKHQICIHAENYHKAEDVTKTGN